MMPVLILRWLAVITSSFFTAMLAIGSKNASPTGRQSDRCSCHKIKIKYDYLILALGTFWKYGLGKQCFDYQELRRRYNYKKSYTECVGTRRSRIWKRDTKELDDLCGSLRRICWYWNGRTVKALSSELWSWPGTSYRIFIAGLKSHPRSGFHEFEKNHSKENIFGNVTSNAICNNQMIKIRVCG